MRVRRTATTATLAALALSGLLLPGTAMADATAPAPTPAPTGAPTGASPAPASDCDALPSRVQGAPTGVKAGARGGDYLWHDAKGWHLRVTHASNDKRIYTGVIHSTNAMTKEPVALESTDSVTLSADRKTLTFRFANYGYIDGVDFTTDCSHALTFALRAGGSRIARGHVYLGAHKVHPAHVPFTVRRSERVTPKPTPRPTPTTTPTPTPTTTPTPTPTPTATP